MARVQFLDFLKDNIVLFDGAMGTEIYAHGIFLNRCYDELNLSQPELIREIHRTYVAAGADVLETNTYGANAFKLALHGYGDQVAKINSAGAKIARKAGGEGLWIAGSIGPLGIRIEPWGPTSEEEARAAFAQQAQALLEGGVDLFILETFSDPHELRQALLAVRTLCALPVIAQMTITEDGNSPFGHPPEQIARLLNEWNPEIIGLNCGVGPQIMLNALERMAPLTTKPLSVMPNAGFPREVEGRILYLSSPEYMAEYARRFIMTGAKIIGGCCGTTPEYIRAMRGAIRSLMPRQRRVKIKLPRVETCRLPLKPVHEKSLLAEALVAGRFVKTVELVPPRGTDVSKALQLAQVLKANAVNAINVPESPRALSRMGSIYLSKIIAEQVGIEPIVHYTCRDRNLLGIISDLLGIHAMGLRNLLMITGDPPKMGDLPQATAVFDIDSIGLVNVVKNLNQGVDLGGNPIGQPTAYFMGVAFNPTAIDPEYERRRFEWKIKAGAEFVITQPVFDLELFKRSLDQIRQPGIFLIAGIWPLTSLRNAEFLNNEVAGVHVPDAILSQLRRARTRTDSLQIGLEIASQLIHQIHGFVNGVQLALPFGNIEYILKVLEVIEQLG